MSSEVTTGTELVSGMDKLSLDSLDLPCPHLFLERIVSNDLIYDLIFNASTAKSLARLLQTCRALRISITDYFSRGFNITTRLAHYFPDPQTFHHLQASTGTIISGSTALQFFDRTYYHDSDLDLYVPLVWRARVGHYLLDQGYTFAPNPRQKSHFDDAVQEERVLSNKAFYGNFKGIASVFNFKKCTSRNETLKVQVIVAARSPMEIILRFHSSKL